MISNPVWKKILAKPFLLAFLFIFNSASAIPVQGVATSTTVASTTVSTVAGALSVISQPERDVTSPEESPEKAKILALFELRPVNQFSILNTFAYVVQRAVRGGVPANTIVLFLLVPFLASLYAFIRHVVGLECLDLLTSIILPIALLATGILSGVILLALLFAAALVARILLKRIRIMQIPRMAMSLFIVSMILLAELILSAYFKVQLIQNLSIFPLLIFVLLSDSVVSLYLRRNANEALMITATTIMFGIAGYFLLASDSVRNAIILYPELVLLTIPANLLVGRYFGLRLVERSRFSELLKKESA